MPIFGQFDRESLKQAARMSVEEMDAQREALNEALEEHVEEIEVLVANAEEQLDMGCCQLVLPVEWRPAGHSNRDFFADGTSFREMMIMWAPVEGPYVAQLTRLEVKE